MAGFDPVGSTPVGALGSASVPGTYISPPSSVLVFSTQQAFVNFAGVKISKANLAVESRPLPGIYISKANVATESHPTPGSYISKANFAVESTRIDSSSKGSVSIIWG